MERCVFYFFDCCGWWCLSWMFCLIASRCLAVYDPNNKLLMAWCRCNGSDYSKYYHPVGGCFNQSEIYSSNRTSTPSRGKPNKYLWQPPSYCCHHLHDHRHLEFTQCAPNIVTIPHSSGQPTPNTWSSSFIEIPLHPQRVCSFSSYSLVFWAVSR